MIPQTTELSQIQAAFIDKDNRIEELMRQINSAQSLLNSLKDTMNSLVGDGKITIQTYAGSNVGDFTVNQKEDKTITLPQQATVNNGTLTIQNNGTLVGTFTANQSGDTTANISVPTKTSDINNDSGYLTASTLPSMCFTYVVDSSQKLVDWANNAAGNDYTSVLIKRGSYSYNGAGVNLTAAGTKVVVGEPGNSISFTRTHTTANKNYGFYYTIVPTTSDYFIYSVNIQSNGYGFTRCCNITNCNVVANNAPYYLCKFIIDCYGKSTGTGPESNSFRNSQFLVNCTGETTTYDWSAFAFCYDLTGCYVSNCYGHGYVGCKRISHCSSDINLKSNNLYDFIGCMSMSHCRAKTRVSRAYASYTENSTYAAADTANGGFNYIGSEI